MMKDFELRNSKKFEQLDYLLSILGCPTDQLKVMIKEYTKYDLKRKEMEEYLKIESVDLHIAYTDEDLLIKLF